MASTRPSVVSTGLSTGFSFSSFPMMVAVAGALLLGSYLPSQAQVSLTGVSPFVGPVNYELSNVTTAGGAQVTGGFSYNGTTVTSVAISTTADSTVGIAADTFTVVQSFATVGAEQQLVATDAAASATIVISFSASLGSASQIAIDPGNPAGMASSISNGTIVATLSGSIVSLAANFGNANVCPAGTGPSPCSQTLTLTYSVNTSTTFATSPTIVTQGGSGLDFQPSSSIPSTCTGPVIAGNSCTVSVTFAPVAPGLRMGAVQLLDGASNVLATTLVGGVGQGPSVAFDPGFATAIGSGFQNPNSMTVDAAGDVFIADYGNSRVVEVPSIGGGTYGSPITLASYPSVYLPAAVAVDGAGDVFISNWGLSQVVELPYLGNGNYGSQIVVAGGIDSQGIAVDAAGDVFISNWGNSGASGSVVEVPAGGGAEATVVSGLYQPGGVAVDAAGDVFVADALNHRVVEVTPSGTQSMVGSGWSNPTGVAVDAAGDVFVSDTVIDHVIEVPADGGNPATVNTGSFTLESPGSPAVDGAGNVYISNISSATGNTYFVVKIARSQPPSLTFPGTATNSTSSAQQVTVQNVGNQQLTGVSGFSVSPSDFIGVAGPGTPADCGGTALLAPGASCDLSITFSPAGVNPTITGTAVFTDNALNVSRAQQIIALSGTGLSPQTIIFGTAPTTIVVGGAGTVSATGGGSSSPIVFTSKSPLVCTVAGFIVSGVTVGSCTIAADQAGDSTHAAAPEVTQTFPIGQGSQAITFGTAPTTVVVGGAGTVSAAGGASGSAVSFTSQTTGVCTVAGSVVSGVAVGACTVAADQAGNANYAAAPTVTQTFSVGKGTQIITFGPAPSVAIGSTVMVSATGGLSNNPISFNSLSLSICTVSGSTVTPLNVGTCVIAANQSGNGNYLDAAQATQNVVVNPAQQAISFAPIPYGVTPTILTATGGGSGLPVTFKVVSGPATVVGNILTINAPGSITVAADQLGDTNYLAALEVTQTIVVTQAAQTISFQTIPNQVMGVTNPFFVTASASSLLPTSLTSTTPSVCTVTGTALSLLSFGQCSIQATQAGNAYYQPVGPVTQSFMVAQETLGTTTLFFSSAAASGSIAVGFLPYPTSSTDFTASAPWVAKESLFVHISLNGKPCVTSPVTQACQVTGTGPGLITFTVDANTNPQSRYVNIVLDSGQTLLIKQAGNTYVGVNPLTTLQSTGFNNPNGMAIDGSGNVYIADSGNNAIKEWIPATALGPAQPAITLVSSGLSNPTGVAVDASGNLYIADTGNHAIEEWIAATQTLTTLMSGLNQPEGIAVDRIGNVYFSDKGSNTVSEWSAATQAAAPLVSSGLLNPMGVAVDTAGNVYIADSGHNAIQQWSVTTHLVAPLVSSGLINPTGVAVDGAGNVYIADNGAGTVKELNAYTQLLTPAETSGFTAPVGVAVDGAGNVYIADTNAVSEILYAFLTPGNYTQPATASTISLFPLIPSTASLTGPFTPATDQPGWIGISTFNGAITLAVGSNVGNPARVGHVTVLGQVYTVTQFGTVSAQTITFGAIANRAYGSGSFTVSATASSGLAVTFSSLATSVCTVSGTTVTLVNVGTCTIQANQAGNSKYAAAPADPQSFQVAQGSQTITFGNLSNHAYGSASFTVSATANSGLTVTFASLTPSACTVSGSTVSPGAVGTCTIQASQPGNTDYAAATSVSQSFQVTQASQTITFATLANRGFSNATFTVSATASSGLTLTFSSTTPSVCSVNVATVNLVTIGTCTIQASQSGNTNYAAATPASRSFTVTQGTQTITFGTLGGKTYGAAPFTVSATAGSGLAVTFTSTTTSVCTVAGNTVTLVTPGTCTIQAAQAGNTNWAAATAVKQSFTVAKEIQTISFAPPASAPFGTPMTLSATATSGLTVSFASTTSTVCTVSGLAVTFRATGTCTIQATQAGNTFFAAATAVSKNIAVTKGNQTIVFAPLPNLSLGATKSFTVSATATSGLTASFASTTSTVCTVSGTLVTLKAQGACTIQATQAGNGNYNAAPVINNTFTVGP